MLRTFANIFRVPDLRKKVLITLFMVAIYRVGTYVPMPGVNTAAIRQVVEKFREGGRQSGPLSLIDLFTGGALGRCTVFALGIMPYISASIIFQLLATVIKPLEELQREGEAGRKKINQYTRYATVGLCLVQSFFVSSWIEGQPFEIQLITPEVQAGPWFELSTMVALTAGSVFLMWLGETLTEYGIGNGISVLIMAGIIDRMPSAANSLWNSVNWDRPFIPSEGGNQMTVLMLAFLLAVYVGIVVGVVIITQGQRRVTVQQAKHTRGHRVYGGQRHYMPLRVGQAGVIPIIFAQSLLTFPSMIFGSLAARWQVFAPLAGAFQVGSFTYTFIYILLIVFFCYFWTAVVFNPLKMAEEMKNYGHFVPGIRPGKMTAQYLERLMTRITLAGSAFLAFIAVFPQLIHQVMNLEVNVAYLYGGTSLLIIVGVALEIVQKIEAQLLMRHYEGFMKRGRIHGRSSW